jgi:CRISPR/Cas system-associated exonuclease Cas4 (RecB family)
MMPTPAEVLTERFWEMKRSRIRVSPCHSTRSSSIGVECERHLFYEQTAWELKTLPPVELQCIFDLGNHVEPYVIREIEAMGVQVYQRGKDYADRRYNITGHIDAKLVIPGFEKPLPAEIKGLNPYTAGKIETLDDIRNHPQQWVRKYFAQLQIYLFLDNSELGVFVLMDKSTGQFRFIECPLDYEFAEALLKKAERVKTAVAANEAPPRMQSAECARCPFVHVCTPDIEFGKGVELFDNPEIEGMLRRREELAAAKSEYEALDKAIKSALPHREELLVGDFALIGSEVSKKGFEVKPSKYWKWEIRRIAQGAK